MREREGGMVSEGGGRGEGEGGEGHSPVFHSSISGAELTKTMTVLTNLRKAANHPLLLRNHYSDDVIAKMSKDILQVHDIADCGSYTYMYI